MNSDTNATAATDAIVDARGLSCPQPVLLALDAVKGRASGTLTVLVDSEASRENVARAVRAKGWTVTQAPAEDDAVALTLNKG